MKSILDPRAKTAKNLNSPGFLQNHPRQQQPSDLPLARREKKQRVKKQALSLSSQGQVSFRGDIIQAEHGTHPTSAPPTSGLPEEAPALEKANPIEVDEMRTKESSILAGAQGAIQMGKNNP